MAGRDAAAQALSRGSRADRAHPRSTLAPGRAFAVGAGKGLSSPETPSLAAALAATRAEAHRCRRRVGEPPAPRRVATGTRDACGAHAAGAPLPRCTCCGQVTDSSGCASGLCPALRRSRGSSRPPAPGRDAGELRKLPAVGRAWQDLPVPTGLSRSPVPSPRPAGLSRCGAMK